MTFDPVHGERHRNRVPLHRRPTLRDCYAHLDTGHLSRLQRQRADGFPSPAGRRDRVHVWVDRDRDVGESINLFGLRDPEPRDGDRDRAVVPDREPVRDRQPPVGRDPERPYVRRRIQPVDLKRRGSQALRGTVLLEPNVKRLVVRDEDAPCRGDRDKRREQPEEEPPQPKRRAPSKDDRDAGCSSRRRDAE